MNPLRRIRIDLTYDGTDYHGWQFQRLELPTIQGTLEELLADLEKAPVHVEGSGRTDAGVHALNQVAAFSIRNPIPVDNLRRAMNRVLPRDIRILRIYQTNPNFHPRFDAVSKTYEYRIWRSEIISPFDYRYFYHHPYPLDEAAMIDAAPVLEGEFDFSAFAASDPRYEESRSKVRRIFRSSLKRQDDRLIYSVTGSGFLKHMVRNIVGVLREIGKGNFTREHLLDRLQPGSGILPGPAAPARGLFLIGVDYEPHVQSERCE